MILLNINDFISVEGLRYIDISIYTYAHIIMYPNIYIHILFDIMESENKENFENSIIKKTSV